MDVSELIGDLVPFDIEWKGKPVKFWVWEESLTPHLLNNIKNAEDYPKALSGAVGDWDLTDKDPDTKYPLTEEAFGRLPIPFLSKMLDRIGDSWSGDKKKSEKLQSGGAAAGS